MVYNKVCPAHTFTGDQKNKHAYGTRFVDHTEPHRIPAPPQLPPNSTSSYHLNLDPHMPSWNRGLKMWGPVLKQTIWTCQSGQQQGQQGRNLWHKSLSPQPRGMHWLMSLSQTSFTHWSTRRRDSSCPSSKDAGDVQKQQLHNI